MRLRQRGLTTSALHDGWRTLEVIESYPEDKYLPSYLVRGQQSGSVFHALLATDVEGDNIRVVTMYAPERAEWDAAFRQRRKRL
jgi:hypothetical protein